MTRFPTVTIENRAGAEIVTSEEVTHNGGRRQRVRLLDNDLARATSQREGSTCPIHWSARYIGIDWLAHGRTHSGCDCWGLARLVYMAEHGIALPSLAGDYLDPLELEEVRAVADGLRGNGQHGETWVEFSPTSWQPRPFDLLLFGGATLHVGLVAEPGRMLHVAHGRPAELTRYEDGRWRHRLAIVGRHRSLA